MYCSYLIAPFRSYVFYFCAHCVVWCFLLTFLGMWSLFIMAVPVPLLIPPPVPFLHLFLLTSFLPVTTWSIPRTQALLLPAAPSSGALPQSQGSRLRPPWTPGSAPRHQQAVPGPLLSALGRTPPPCSRWGRVCSSGSSRLSGAIEPCVLPAVRCAELACVFSGVPPGRGRRVSPRSSDRS